MARFKFKEQEVLEEGDFEEEEEVEEEEERPRRERPQDRRKPSKGREAGRERRGGKSSNRFVRYFQDTGDELRKVTWPSRQQTLRLSLIVLVSMIVVAIFLWLVDFSFQQVIALLVAGGQ